MEEGQAVEVVDTADDQPVSDNEPEHPVDLHRELRIQAAVKGVSMKDLIIKYCQTGLRKEKAKKGR